MFSVETAIVDEIVRYNKVDCPFVLSSNFSESVKEKVDKNFRDVYNLPTLWRLHRASFSSPEFPVYNFQVFNLKRLVWETSYLKMKDVSEWKEYLEGKLMLEFNRGRIQYDTLINNAKEFLKNEEGCVIYEATTTPEWRTKE